jgi:hypothetical protein
MKINSKLSLLQNDSTFIYRQKTQKLYLFFNLTLQVWRNCQVLSAKTSDSSAFLTAAMCLVEYVLNCEHQFSYVGYEILSEVAMNGAIFRDIAPYSSYMNRHFRGIYHIRLQGQKDSWARNHHAAGNCEIPSSHSSKCQDYCYLWCDVM